MGQRDDHIPRKESSSSNPRRVSDATVSRVCFTGTPTHPLSLSIEEALKECIRIPIKEFALIVVLESGEESTYTSQSLTAYETRIFSPDFRDDFRRNVRIAATEIEPDSFPSPYSSVTGQSAYSHDQIYSEFDICHGKDFDPRLSRGSSSNSSDGTPILRQSRSDDDVDMGPMNAKRKLVQLPAYPTQYAEDDEDDEAKVYVSASGRRNEQLMIADEVEVQNFYRTRFLDMQQAACKIVGKAFVKYLEPRKQSQHPYTKGNAAAPPWWPPTEGHNNVRHKEPDHLLKPERVRLLVWILGMFVNPNDQQLAMTQKLGLDISQLEEVTMEALSTWFHDKQHPENVAKEPYLREIFKVAKAQERYNNGGIDESAFVLVSSRHRSEAAYLTERPDNSWEAVSLRAPQSFISQSTMQEPHVLAQAENEFDNMAYSSSPCPMPYHTKPVIERHQSFPDSSCHRSKNGAGTQQQDSEFKYSGRHHFDSTQHHGLQQNSHRWPDSSLVGNGPNSCTLHATTSPGSFLASWTEQQQVPVTNPHQNMLPLPCPTNSHVDRLPKKSRYDVGPAPDNPLRVETSRHRQYFPTAHSFQEYPNENVGWGDAT